MAAVLTSLGYVAIQKHSLPNRTGAAPRHLAILPFRNLRGNAVLGDKNSAMRVLRHSINNGVFPHTYFETDPLLENLRGEPEFSGLMNIARRRYDTFQKTFFSL